MTRPVKINRVSTKNCLFFPSLLYHNLRTVYTNTIKFVTTVEFNELSSEIYGNGIPHSELKILAIIQLSVICAHMIDFRRPGHIYSWIWNFDIVSFWLKQFKPLLATLLL